MTTAVGKYQFAIDRGGTFTDVWARTPDGRVIVDKLLSVDPQHYKDSAVEGIRRLLSRELGTELDRHKPISGEYVDWVRLGTTVATNALLERQGEKIAVAVTEGFHDFLHIGTQARANIFDLTVSMPKPIYDTVVEVKERVVCCHPGAIEMSTKKEKSVTDESVEIWQELDVEKTKTDLEHLRKARPDINSLVVILINSYLYPKHEELVGEIARSVGFSSVTLSSKVVPMARAVQRGQTAIVDGYLTPVLRRHVDNFLAGFSKDLPPERVLFMQSDGGLVPAKLANGARSVLSGPAGGVIGYGVGLYGRETELPLIGFDMGGTSTDVSRFAGSLEYCYESEVSGAIMQLPHVDIETVAAGGGSRLFFIAGKLVVGPESAGANPGPACYRRGGPLCVTDANLILGRLLPEFFPPSFGPNRDENIDIEATQVKFQQLFDEANQWLAENGGKKFNSIQEMAEGFLSVANETMCRPIRSVTQARGLDASKHALCCFGGAGAQHAAAVAKSLGITKVVIPRLAGVLCAVGIALADLVEERQEPASMSYSAENFNEIDEHLENLAKSCITKILPFGFEPDQIEVEYFVNMRYDRTDFAIMVPGKSPCEKSPKCGDFMAAFLQLYQREFGFTLPDRKILVDDLRVRASAKSGVSPDAQFTTRKLNTPPHGTSMAKSKLLEALKVKTCWFSGEYYDTPMYDIDDLKEENVPGPALIATPHYTVVVEPGWVLELSSRGNLILNMDETEAKKHKNPALLHAADVEATPDAALLAVLEHRFMSIAEQMGRALQRTAISVNIKERLDFSCAVFGPDGGLVANAPHIPVHLGSMQDTVKYQLEYWRKQPESEQLKPGDVLLSNHPSSGGAHLPDLTVIAPVFNNGNDSEPAFFVASRGHHADIGGCMPGSMPHNSRHIWEEGASFTTFKLLKRGQFNEAGLIDKFEEPAKHEGCSGARNVADNIADLRAQVAACKRGGELLGELVEEYSLPLVRVYTEHIRRHADAAVRHLIKTTAKRFGSSQLKSSDMMDDGSTIRLTVHLDPEKGEADFDFTETSEEVYGNWNCPRSVAMSGVLYCLRSMIGSQMPLNAGCLAPIRIKFRDGTLLSPSANAAVVAGNVQTSQRVVDVVLRAFQASAASQGCMNNVTFGRSHSGTCHPEAWASSYYETIAGGAGAGPTWEGRSGVHSHMTNTRITDIELLERRFPVAVTKFTLRPGSGGAGKFRGGEGVIRELVFRAPTSVSLLTERRVTEPYGMNEGEPGQRGRNLLIKTSERRTVALPSKTGFEAEPRDRILLLTPGGGGYGAKD